MMTSKNIDRVFNASSILSLIISVSDGYVRSFRFDSGLNGNFNALGSFAELLCPA